MQETCYRVIYGIGYLIAGYKNKEDAFEAAQKFANTGKFENVRVIEYVASEEWQFKANPFNKK